MTGPNSIERFLWLGAYLQTVASTPQEPLTELQVVGIAAAAGAVGALAETLRLEHFSTRELGRRLVPCVAFSVAAFWIVTKFTTVVLTPLPVAGLAMSIGLFSWPLAERARKIAPDAFVEAIDRLRGKKGDGK